MKRSKQSKPLKFLAKAQTDKKLSDRVLAAVERGGQITGEEVLQIAKEFGYSFTRSEFERDVKRSFADRFGAGGERLGRVGAKRKPPPKPPLSSCARGCLSYTVSWHPTKG